MLEQILFNDKKSNKKGGYKDKTGTGDRVQQNYTIVLWKL